MDVITVAGEQYEIYTKAEADQRELDYVPWKQAQTGDYALTDDGYVAECRKRYKTSGDDQVVLACGRAFVNYKSTINWEDYKEVGNVSFNKPQTWQEKEIKKGRTQRAINFYALQKIKGVPDSKMPWDIIGKLYRPDQQRPDLTARRLFRETEIMQEVNKQIISILDGQGFSDEEIINHYKELLEKAKKEDDLTNLRLTLSDITKMKGIDKPHQKETVREESWSAVRQISDGINKERQQLNAKRKITSEEDEDEQG